jgi:hypothetical protein
MLAAGHPRIRSTRPLLAGQRTTQPRLRESEVVADGVCRTSSDLGRFLRRQTSEIAQLNRLGQDGILRSKLVEGAIQFEQRQEILAVGSQLHSRCLDAMKVAASFSGRSSARVINQDPPHHPGCDRQKMSLVGDIRRGGAKHSNVDFIDQRRGLQRVVFPIFSKIPPGNGAKLSGISSWDAWESPSLTRRSNSLIWVSTIDLQSVESHLPVTAIEQPLAGS